MNPIEKLNGKKGLLAIALLMAVVMALPFAAQYYTWSTSYSISKLISPTSITIPLGTHSGATKFSYTTEASVTDEVLATGPTTLTEGATITLSHAPVKPGSDVLDFNNDTSLVRDTDYSIDYSTGTIKWLHDITVADRTSLYADYKYSVGYVSVPSGVTETVYFFVPAAYCDGGTSNLENEWYSLSVEFWVDKNDNGVKDPGEYATLALVTAGDAVDPTTESNSGLSGAWITISSVPAGNHYLVISITAWTGAITTSSSINGFDVYIYGVE
jgi:hypothetical protein